MNCLDSIGKPLTREQWKVRAHLVKTARKGEWTTYGEVSAIAGMHHRDPKLGPFLGAISAFEHQAGRPLLSALVVHENRPHIQGNGFFTVCKHLGTPGAQFEDKKLCSAIEIGRCWGYWGHDREITSRRQRKAAKKMVATRLAADPESFPKAARKAWKTIDERYGHFTLAHKAQETRQRNLEKQAA